MQPSMPDNVLGMEMQILRRRQACERLACKRTKFSEDYEFHDAADPYVPGTQIPRVKAIPLGTLNVGFAEHHINALIEALIAAGGHKESKAARKTAARDAMLLRNTKVARRAQAVPSTESAKKKPRRPQAARAGAQA
jgi:hypothetical protein